MHHPALDQLMGDLIGDCQAACVASDLAAETAGGDPAICVPHLHEVARLISHVEHQLQHHFLEPAPVVPVFGESAAAPPDSAGSAKPSAPPLPPPPVLPPADPVLRTLTTPTEVGLLVHEIRGIRTVFVLGAELDLKPADREPLFVAAAAMTRRLEPLIRDFFARLGGAADTGELKVES